MPNDKTNNAQLLDSLAVPAIHVNKFFIAADNQSVRISFAEMHGNIPESLNVRGALHMSRIDALQLAQALMNMVHEGGGSA